MDERLEALRRRAYSDPANIDRLWHYIRALERAGSFKTQFPSCGTTTVACHVLTESDRIHPHLYKYLCVRGWNLCLTASPDIWTTSPDVVEDFNEWVSHHFYNLDPQAEIADVPFINSVPKHLFIDLINTWPSVVRYLDTTSSQYDAMGIENLFYGPDGSFQPELYFNHKLRFIELVDKYLEAGYKYLILDFSLLTEI